MLELMMAVMATAVLSSVLTLGVAWWFYRTRIEPQLPSRLSKVQAEFQERVRLGVLEAGEELLPAFRKQVAAGFRDAINGVATERLGESTARAMSRGADIFEKGLRGLFGGREDR